MTTEGDPAPTRAQKFGEYVTAAARAAGYDIDNPRGGGKKALAEKSGMSHASVSRMLAGQTIPDPKFFESLAGALGVEVGTMLVRAGVISESALTPRPPSPPQVIDPREVARSLGITSPEKIEAFVAMTRALVEPEGHASRRSA
ncbi:helix-turn-helix transcriptional regulator [Streptomyces sp. NBC_01723]|uniref:helix-turn-helix domain-containing protein n=1 Tax=Streptomyces sp. NBC_01723 TaxID=2975921 RepID=UPI002E3523E3|nr:helix-turn-helix transcriptional regulator [Streptomyces sp. NBC_01723]